MQLSLFDPIQVQTKQGFIVSVDPQDADLVLGKWSCASTLRKHFYIQLANGTKLHRVILARMLGRELSRHELVDHADGNSLNNCRSNLRLATHGQNSWNSKRRSDNHSGYKGVGWRKDCGAWRARIKVGGTIIALGCFDTPEQAYEVYCRAAKEYAGEFARFE